MEKKKMYKTHWHSFIFGFMCSLAIVLFVLLVFTATDRITFSHTKSKNVKTADVTSGSQEEKVVTAQGQSIEEIASDLDVDMEQFTQCMEEVRFAQAVQDDIDSGTAAGVKGTPHSFVFIDDAVYEIPGAYDASGIRDFFDDLLAGNDPRATDISDETDIAAISDDDWVVGNENARISVIMYSDIDCPFCKKFHSTVTSVMDDYTEDVQWAFRHMPIDGLHPNAREKAEAAECIGEIGGGVKFWEYLDTVFAQK